MLCVCVALEKLDITTQIMLFRYATTIIAQHGSALVNTVWCKKCQLVIEYNSGVTNWFPPFFQFTNKWIVESYQNQQFINVNIGNTIHYLEKYIVH
jgi:capsular polysaccharide biosynthesis protein